VQPHVSHLLRRQTPEVAIAGDQNDVRAVVPNRIEHLNQLELIIKVVLEPERNFVCSHHHGVTFRDIPQNLLEIEPRYLRHVAGTHAR
jgi:hypothetical protein